MKLVDAVKAAAKMGRKDGKSHKLLYGGFETTFEVQVSRETDDVFVRLSKDSRPINPLCCVVSLEELECDDWGVVK